MFGGISMPIAEGRYSPLKMTCGMGRAWMSLAAAKVRLVGDALLLAGRKHSEVGTLDRADRLPLGLTQPGLGDGNAETRLLAPRRQFFAGEDGRRVQLFQAAQLCLRGGETGPMRRQGRLL